MPAIRIAAEVVDNAEPHHAILLKIPTYNRHYAISSRRFDWEATLSLASRTAALV